MKSNSIENDNENANIVINLMSNVRASLLITFKCYTANEIM